MSSFTGWSYIILVHHMASFPYKTTHAPHAYLSAYIHVDLPSSWSPLIHPPSSSYPSLTSTSPSQHISPLGSQGEEPDSIHFWIWTFEQSAVEWGGQWVRTCEGETYKINLCMLVTILYKSTHLPSCLFFKWLPSQWPYFKQDHPIAPNVTAGGVLVVEKCLRGSPLERDTPTLWEVVVSGKVTGHAEIGNLSKKELGDVLPRTNKYIYIKQPGVRSGVRSGSDLYRSGQSYS